MEMKFALLSADPSHKVRFKINCEQGDCTSFLNWVDIWGGVHLSFEALRKEDNSYLKGFDVVMMSGHPHYIQDVTRIAGELKGTEAVTMFYPEGSLQLYDASMYQFHPEYYEAWNACDIVSSAEEDKLGYYRSYLKGNTIARFIHVPCTAGMTEGKYLLPREKKQRYSVVYGDNNPNHPGVAIACAEKLGLPVVTVAIEPGRIADFKKVFPGIPFHPQTKLSQAAFLRVLGQSAVHFYPTEWIGTARQQIACAIAGTPCIGNHDSHTQRRLYPKELAFDIYDIEGMVGAARRLLEDGEWYNLVVREAFEKAGFYGLEATKGRFMEAVETAREMKRTRLSGEKIEIVIEERRRAPGVLTEAVG